MYVIARAGGSDKMQLFQTRGQRGALQGRVPDEGVYTGQGAVLKIAERDIVVPLGMDPPVGKVYGVPVEPIRDRWIVPRYGTVYNYVPRLVPDVRARLERALVQSRAKVERLYGGVGTQEWITRYKNPVGKALATYAYHGKGTDVLTMYTDSSVGLRELVKVGSHEMGHCVWHRVFTAEDRATWIKFFGRFVAVAQVEIGAIKKMVRDIRQIASVRDYLRDCEPEDAAACGIYLGWLKRVHSLSPREVQDLVASGNELPVPDAHLHRSNTNTPVTLYSKENPAELFCEALSSHVVGDLNDRHMLRMITGR